MNNTKRIWKWSSALILTILCAGSLKAVPAKPGLLIACQPDGTEVKIRLEGNETGKFAYSEDGYPLTVDADGFYVFLTLGDDGTPIASSNREINISERKSTTVSFLTGLDPKAIGESLKKENNARRKTRKGPGLRDTTFPSKGKQRAIAILVEFDDMEFRIENPKEYYYNMLNQEGFSQYGATGSARDYFVDSSIGVFDPEFDVYGPVKLPGSYSYYGRNNAWGDDAGATEMIIKACTLLDDEIDFTDYDRNEDGEIDNVYVFYAGYGEADGGGATTIWPHSSDIVEATGKKNYFDGVLLNHYACSNEIQYTTKLPDGIGTFCHEFSHVLGLPDLYSTIFDAFTPGYWDILAFGSYNNSSRTPPTYSSFSRYALDWMEPRILTNGEKQLFEIGESNKAYIIPTEKENEYYLLENRQKVGWDEHLPWHGMIVWHVDFIQKMWDNNTVNSFTDHQYVDLVEADNIRNNETITGDPFPGIRKVREFSSNTKPALLSWAGNDLGYRIYNIQESEDGVISFIVEGDDSAAVEDVVPEPDFIKIIGNSVRFNKEGVIIYDISGRQLTSGTNTIELPAGIYIATDGLQTRKFIIY